MCLRSCPARERLRLSSLKNVSLGKARKRHRSPCFHCEACCACKEWIVCLFGEYMSRRSEGAQPEQLNRHAYEAFDSLPDTSSTSPLSSIPKVLAEGVCVPIMQPPLLVSHSGRHLLFASPLTPPLTRPIAALMNSWYINRYSTSPRLLAVDSACKRPQD